MPTSFFKSTLLIFSFFASSIAAAESVALNCGPDIQVVSQYGVVGLHPAHNRGQIVNEEMELGEVTIVQDGSTIVLNKTEEADRGFGGFGRKKGFGMYEAPFFYRLDLRNTFDNYQILLEDLRTGQVIECTKPKGDCC